ncbi:hypothetical protein [Sphingopyxis sp. QXT-31]|uniref:hypothetical protein n=1 Tax=Sphingopyxis sp. QXT-31 TaxID=1357916 RepID=UPI0012ECAF12|nr:hypothetical protein [Sphingopyxis sp. QXT-31]
MPGIIRAIALSTLVALPMTVPPWAAAEEAQHLSEYLVVTGKVETLDNEVIDEWGLNLIFTARMRIARVISGQSPRSATISIRYIGHGPMLQNKRMRLRLRRSEDGIYLVCSRGGSRGYICEDKTR